MKVIGIDLGGTKVAAAVVDSNGKTSLASSHPTQLSEGWRGLKGQLTQICKALLESEKRITSVGIGSAGPLHAPSGRLLDPTNFGWKPQVVSIALELKKSLGVPVYLENDAAAAALAERWKGGASDDSVVLTLGTGLGVGVLLDGRLFRGARGLHPELGHLFLRPEDSTLCGCGNRGCSEALLSGMNFGKRGSQALNLPNITAKELTELARQGNAQALQLFHEYSLNLALYLANLVVAFYPKDILLAGSFAQAHDLFLPAAKIRLRELLKRREKTLKVFPSVKISKLGNRSGILGAAFVAINHKTYFC